MRLKQSSKDSEKHRCTGSCLRAGPGATKSFLFGIRIEESKKPVRVVLRDTKLALNFRHKSKEEELDDTFPLEVV